MKLDLLYTLHNPSAGRDWQALLNELRRHTTMAEEAGFDTFWLGEHHFDWDGSDLDPNPLLMFADLGARTTSLKFGTAGIVLPLWHPLRLAEEIAMVDHFLTGRLSIGFARGVVPNEVLNLNPAADRWRDPEASREIYREAYGALRAAWSDESFSWSSKRYTFPGGGIPKRRHPNPNVDPAQAQKELSSGGFETDMTLVPRCYQNPFPKLYSLTDTTRGFVEAAELDMDPITWFPTGRKLDGLLDAYRTARAEKLGAPVNPSAPLGGVLRLAFVAPTERAAREASEHMVEGFYSFMSTYRGLDVLLDEGESPDDPEIAGKSGWDVLTERNQVMVGTPDQVIQKIVEFKERYNPERLMIEFGFGNMTNEQAEPALVLWGEEVIPALRREGVVE